MLKVFRITLYVLGGFCVYVLNLLSFISMPSLTLAMKLGIMAVFAFIGLLPILIAMATNRFQGWKVPLGAVLLSGAALTGFVVLTVLCMQLSPELLKAVPDFHPDFLSDYLFGGVTTLILVLAGVILVRSSSEGSNRSM